MLSGFDDSTVGLLLLLLLLKLFGTSIDIVQRIVVVAVVISCSANAEDTNN